MRTVKVMVLCLAALMVVSAMCSAAAPPPKRGASPNWWGPAPNPTPTVAGVVVNIAPDRITLNLERGPQAFLVTPKTEIIVAGQRATLADIKLGDPCTLRLQIMPQGLPIALRIAVRQPAQPKLPVVGGIVASVSADRITLNTPSGQQGFVVTKDTQIVVYGKRAAIGDVNVGVRAEVVFRPTEGGPGTAVRISVAKPRAAGMIDAINGNVLTVRDKDMIWHVTVPDGAKITCRTYQGTLADLQIGYRVGVSGQFNGPNVVADVVEFMPIMLKGVVTAVDGNQITVATTQQTIVTGVLSDKTMVLVRPRVGDNRPGTPSDIKVESPVDIGGSMSEGGPYQGGTMQLLLVDVLVGK